MDKKKELTMHLYPPVSGVVMAVLFFVGGIVFSIVVKSFLPLALFGVLALGVGVICSLPILRMNKHLRQMEESGELSAVLADFENSQKYLDGALRLGNTYLFGKESGAVYRYSDLTKIYRFDKYRNFTLVYRDLTIVLHNKKKRSLCPLPLKDLKNWAVTEALEEIAKHNRTITFGK